MDPLIYILLAFVTKVHGATLLALRGGGCQICKKKQYLHLNGPIASMVK